MSINPLTPIIQMDRQLTHDAVAHAQEPLYRGTKKPKTKRKKTKKKSRSAKQCRAMPTKQWISANKSKNRKKGYCRTRRTKKSYKK